MNFSDLLDEDGQGSRKLDAWLAENIAGEDVKWDDYWECYKTGDIIVTEAHPVHVKPFTTGDSIDPILNLANDYLNTWTIHKRGKYEHSVEPYKHEFETLQLAIAHKLFKAYQKENAITTKEAVEKYDDPENSFPPKGDE